MIFESNGKRRLYLIALCFVYAFFTLSASRSECQEQKEEPQRTVSLSTLEAKVNPHFEFTLPSGNISERIEQQFNNLHTVFDLNFNFLNSSVDAGVTFAYPLGFFVPGIRFYQNVDLENLVAPQLQGGELTLLPAEKYVSRIRGIELDFVFNVTPVFSIIPSFLMNDTFKGSFTTGLSLDEGIDWIARMSFAVDSGRSQPEGSPVPDNRVAFSSAIDTRFRNSLTNPVSIDHNNTLQTTHQLRERVFITETLGFNYPMYTWHKDISSFYSLGGFDSLRGYPYGSIAAFRYVLNRFDLGVAVFRNAQIKIKLGKRRATIGDYRLFFILDGLLTQNHLSWDSPVNTYGGGGGGFVFLISGERQQHIKVSTYIVQPIEAQMFPIFYFQTSFFNFEKRI
ncbi:MAG: hypothetical protein JSV89_07740 [Spirochaetaceae bacterium]|nr:MAG: hypothetical protein JSV89_07740 [Spirochaetaceae bacterium]